MPSPMMAIGHPEIMYFKEESTEKVSFLGALGSSIGARQIQISLSGQGKKEQQVLFF
jgi:hypothetical protein